MPYVAELEEAGIPTVLVEFADQKTLVDSTSMRSGCPNMRRVTASRVGTGPERVAEFWDDMIAALTDPVTAKEKESGIYTPPPSTRIAFEGSLQDAQEFFQQTRPIDHCSDCPIAKYTDGLPIIVPTEERVMEMLQGTSHSPSEIITLPVDIGRGKQGDVVEGALSDYTFTVETVAINAVMAGAKSEYLPVILAISNTGMGVGTTSAWSTWQVVSGPIAKEIGMNAEMGLLGPGNPANATIGRTYWLMAVNIGGAQVGVTWESTHSSPTNLGGMCFPEDADKLPEGWLGLNEESGYQKSESIVMSKRSCDGFILSEFAPSGYRALQAHGEGGMAVRLGVEGQAGPHNFLEYFIPGVYSEDLDPIAWLMIAQLAEDLKTYGFASKQAVYDWWWEASKITAGEYKTYGWWDNRTRGGTRNEPTSGIPYNDLPDDYLIPAAGSEPFSNVIIVAGGLSERIQTIPGGRGTIYPIDPWR